MGGKRYYDSIKAVCEAQAERAGDAPSASDLFRAEICRALLGGGVGPRAAAASAGPPGRLNADLLNCARRAAAAELRGERGDAEAARAFALLDAAGGDANAGNSQIVESALALALLAGDGARAALWRAAGLSLPEAAKHSWTAELLLMSAGDEWGGEDLKVFALAAARNTERILWAAPFSSAAPQVCALAALARRRGLAVRALLGDRLRELDEIVFGAGDEPCLSFGDPAFSYGRDGEGGAASLAVEVGVGGEGELRAGAYPLEAVTYGLLRTVQSAFEEIENMGGRDRAKHRKLIDDVLYAEGGRCAVRLVLDEGVRLPPEQEPPLRRRFELGVEITRRQIEGLAARFELEIAR